MTSPPHEEVGRPGLHLVAADEEAIAPDDAPLAWPVLALGARPSELPAPVTVALHPPAARRVAMAAQQHGGAAGAWTRAAVECERQLHRATQLTRLSRQALVSGLNEAARRGPELLSLGDAPLFAYARSLRDLEPGRASDVPTHVTVHLPDELGSAWAREAANSQESLDGWVGRLVIAAPAEALVWEAASAVASTYLAEWVLAEALSLSSRRA